ncbi:MULTISPECIES: polysaccharide pyruvyl transferase family protein [Virgibacillus]|uniref:polysaccharide pyruvyl transferase family protein n=1 Tax=Virgibacillus TaxID=84406 RepID=UPI0003886487|nr:MULTISPECIES: polysaccharide pyruvyl transferase family protein [Virgibacillus]EQB38109.1 hypothetical protein M948_05920 [Virgibacillus sp. CM-4]MYL40823.1 hypothetical protein [Virgibacillus massiliensis]
MNNIMLYAYTQHNLGDDLFIKILCDRYPNTTFHLLAPRDYDKTFLKLKNLNIIPRDSLFFRGGNWLATKMNQQQLLSAFLSRECDAVVYAGGSLFIQHADWKRQMKQVKAMYIKEKPFFLLGANFGPHSDQAFLMEYHQLFQQFTDICFRDQYSYTLFNDLPNVRVATDMAFQLETTDTKTASMMSVIISVIKPSIRSSLRGYDAIYYNKVSEIARYFMIQGYTVTLMSFCGYERDHEAINSIIHLLSDDEKNQIRTFYYQYKLEEALTLLSSSAFIVATRFHSMILGWLFQKPVFPIVYSSKMTNILNDINFQGSYTTFDGLKNLKAENVYESVNTNTVDISNQISKAGKQFFQLDSYLKTKT